MKTKFIVLLSCLFSLQTMAIDAFEKGVEAFRQGDYDAAYTSWSSISGESAALHYNIGNYWFMKGELGKSILHYEKALKIAPNDDEIIHNLEIAKKKRIDEFEVLPTSITERILTGFLNLTHSNTWLLFGLISFALSTLVWIFFLKSTQSKRTFFFAFITAGFIGFCFIALSFGRYKIIDSKEHAIITSPNVYVKNGPSENENDAFILHEGTKIEIKTHENNWAKIKLPDGKIGWVTMEHYTVI